MVCGLLGILTACTLLSSSCQRLLSYTVAYCPTVIATVNDSLADGYQEAMQDWTAKYAGLVTSSQEGIPLVVATYMTRDFKMPMQLT